MKKLFLLLLFPMFAHAADVGLDFRGVGVVDLAEGVIKGVLKRDYIIAPDVAGNPAKLTMSVRSIDKDKVLPVLKDILQGAGLTIEDKGGVLYLEAKKTQPIEPQATQAATAQGMQPAQMFNPLTGQPYPVAGFGGQYGGQQPHIIPKELAFHRPRGKSMEFLASVAKLAGAYVPEVKGKGDVLVYGGDPEVIEKTRKLLEQIDTATPSLVVKAALLEFTTSESESRSLSLALTALAGKFGAVYQAGSKLANSLMLNNANLQAALSAIDGDSRFKYIAEPSLRVMDGEQARFVVGSEVPTRSGAILDKNGNPIQSVEYRTAGVVITVQPKLVRDGVHVKIGQQVSSFALTTTSGIDSPTILKREAETTITAADGELIIIAGMDETRESGSTSGLSFLPSFLRSKDHQNSRSQMLLMLEVKRQPTEI